jgi:hypothetical protein
MENFINYIDSIKNIETLMSLKKHIKDEIVKPIHWELRMDLYNQVQLIIKRIEELQKQNQWKNSCMKMYG